MEKIPLSLVTFLVFVEMDGGCHGGRCTKYLYGHPGEKYTADL